MKNNIKKIKIVSIVIFSIGLILGGIGIIIKLFGTKSLGVSFPRNDLVHIGFYVVSAIYIVIALGVYFSTKDKKAMEQEDERGALISAKSALVALMVLILLLVTTIFLLCFMGYLNTVAMFSLLAVTLVGMVVFFVCNLYYSKKM